MRASGGSGGQGWVISLRREETRDGSAEGGTNLTWHNHVHVDTSRVCSGAVVDGSGVVSMPEEPRQGNSWQSRGLSRR